MTDRRPPDNGEEADLIVERVLSDALMTSPLEDHRRERLRNVVMKEWRAALPASRTMSWATRGWWIGFAAAAGLVAVTLAIVLSAPVGDSALFGSVARLNDGGIELRSGWFRSQTLQVADALRVGQHLTVHGSALVTLPGGGSLRIGAGSSLYIAQATELSLERGLIYVDTPLGETPSNPLRVATVAGVVEHVGTQFEVMSDSKAVRIRVREGKVRFSSASGELEASAGTELLTMSGGQVARQSIPTYGRDWLWTAALAPDYDIEGRSLMGFLQWASRELGRPLDFADRQSRDVAGDLRHPKMRVRSCVSVAGEVFDRSHHPVSPCATNVGRYQISDLSRIFAKGTRIDDGVRRVGVYIRNRKEIPMHADGAGFLGRDPAKGLGILLLARRTERHGVRKHGGPLQPHRHAALKVSGKKQRQLGVALQPVEQFRRLIRLAAQQERTIHMHCHRE